MLLTNEERVSESENCVMQEKVWPVAAGQSRHRLWWVMPKPFDWLSSSLYIGIFAVAVVQAPGVIALWQIALLAAILLALLLIDRLEYWRYGERVPARVALLLFILRIVLIQCTIPLEGFNFTPFLYFILPYLAVVYFGNRAGYSQKPGGRPRERSSTRNESRRHS
jgi:hypothetical protein